MIPIEWLRGVEERVGGYRRLVNDEGDLSTAAWRLAQARCRAWEVSTNVPTAAEVHAAARTIVRRGGWDGPLPSNHALASECESHGLLVL